MTNSKGYNRESLSKIASVRHISNLDLVISKLNLDITKDVFPFQYVQSNWTLDATIYCNIKGKASGNILSFKVYDKDSKFVQGYKQGIDKKEAPVLTVAWELSTLVESLEPFGSSAMNAEDL